jgi:hypothetical protein
VKWRQIKAEKWRQIKAEKWRQIKAEKWRRKAVWAYKQSSSVMKRRSSSFDISVPRSYVAAAAQAQESMRTSSNKMSTDDVNAWYCACVPAGTLSSTNASNSAQSAK